MLPAIQRLVRSRLFRDISLLTACSWTAQALLLYRSYLIPSSLGPEDYGIWRLVTLILFYCTFTHLGTIEAYQREIPVLRGKGEYSRMRLVGETTWSFWNLMSSLAMLVILIYSFFNRHNHGPAFTHCLYLTAPLLLLQSIQYFLSSKLSSEIKFAPVSISMILGAVINVAGMWILIPMGLFDVFGALYVFMASNLIVIAYLYYHARPKILAPIDPQVLKHLLKVGFPITIFLVLSNTLVTIDQVLVLKIRGTAAMGIYGLGFSLIMILMRVPSMVGMAIDPRFMEYAGKNGLNKTAYMLISEQIMVLGLVVPFFAGLAAIAFPPFLKIFLPDFIASTPVIHAALLGFTIFSFTYPLKSMIILRHIQWRCIPILVGGLIACVGLNMAALYLWKDALAPVAIGSAIAYCLVTIAKVLYVIGPGLSNHRGGAMAFFTELLGSVAAAVILVWILLRWVRIPGESIQSDLVSMTIQASLFALSYGIFSIKGAKALYERINLLTTEKHD